MRPRGGFTLLEMLAVVTIFALLASFAMPNVSALRTRALQQEAERMAAQLELARQRTIVTGIPHRLYIDLDAGAYRLEWLGDDPAGAFVTSPEALVVDRNAPLPLRAPREEEREYQRMYGRDGRLRVLEGELRFAGVETNGGWIDRGETFIGFERDGSTEYATIVLDDGRSDGIALQVLPLAEAVRITDATELAF